MKSLKLVVSCCLCLVVAHASFAQKETETNAEAASTALWVSNFGNQLSQAPVVPLLSNSEEWAWLVLAHQQDESANQLLPSTLVYPHRALNLPTWDVPAVFLNSGMFASSDGQYLAQSEKELQTYYDLGMTYQYIESPVIRQQLQLADDEGIIILSTKEDADGHRIGFRQGDLVLKVDDRPVDTQYDLVIALNEKRGDNTSVVLRREGIVQDLDFELSAVQIKPKKRWIIGVSVDEMDETLRTHLQSSGVVISSVTEDGPAQKMGLQIHDVITKIDDTDVEDLAGLRSAVQASNGSALTLQLIRSGNQMSVQLTPVQADDVDTTINPNVVLDHSLVIPMVDLTVQRNVLPYQSVDVQWDLTKPSQKNEEESGVEAKIQQVLDQIEELKQQVESLQNSLNK